MSTRKFIKKLTAIEYERCISKRILENFMFRHMTSMMLELILIAALGVILEWLAQANQSIGVQLHKLPSRNYDFDQLWMKLFLNPVMSIC